jgi:sugar phosphate isomerase/epimerase
MKARDCARTIFSGLLLGVGALCCGAIAAPARAVEIPDNLKTGNLAAWCIVPFDARKRGPAERAVMLEELGLRRCAYDWRREHVAQFEEEILQYKKHGIEYFAFWGSHDEAFRLFKKYDLHPQIWNTLGSPTGGSQKEKIETAARSMETLAMRTAELGCKLGLYNHGGWGGEPANLVAVCQRLHALGHRHVGIVYNWHHGHGHIDDWQAVLTLMKPYLHCLNLNGMNTDAKPKILPLAQGAHDLAMLKVVAGIGYAGPIGILDHQGHLDSKEALQDNLDGLAWLTKELAVPGSGGKKPTPKAKKFSPQKP